MFFWTALSGRGYCYYCPVGVLLGWLGRAAGQKIVTTKSECSGCCTCAAVCPMSIRISARGCSDRTWSIRAAWAAAACVDACPLHTLEYSTAVLRRVRRDREGR